MILVRVLEAYPRVRLALALFVLLYVLALRMLVVASLFYQWSVSSGGYYLPDGWTVPLMAKTFLEPIKTFKFID